MLAGEGEAYDSFSALYPRALYRFVLAKLDGDRELTREIVQTALCKALANLQSYRGEAALLTWLCSCCRNEVLMHLRRTISRPVELELEDEIEPAVGFRTSEAGDPEISVLRREAADRVHMALDVLPEHYARALEWKYFERVPVREIALRLKLGQKAAESLLTRARQAFKAGYEGLARERDSCVSGR